MDRQRGATRLTLAFAIHPHARFHALNAGTIQQEIDDIPTVPIGSLRLRIHSLETGETIRGRLNILFQAIDIDTPMERALKAFAFHNLPGLESIRTRWHRG